MVKDKDERDRLVALKKLEKKGKLGDRDSVEQELARKERHAAVDYEKKAKAASEAGLEDSEDWSDEELAEELAKAFEEKRK